MHLVLRQSYLETNSQLRLQVDKIRFYSEMEQELRGLLRRMRIARSRARNQPVSVPLLTSIPTFGASNSSAKPSLPLEPRMVPASELGAKIAQVEELATSAQSNASSIAAGVLGQSLEFNPEYETLGADYDEPDIKQAARAFRRATNQFYQTTRLLQEVAKRQEKDATGKPGGERSALGRRPAPRTGTNTLPPPPKGRLLVLQGARARSLPKGMTRQEQASVAKVVSSLRGGNTNAVKQDWGNLVTSMVKRKASPTEISTVMDVVLRSCLETNSQLRLLADKVRFYSEVERELRNLLRRMFLARSQAENKPVSVPVLTAIPTFDASNSSEQPSLALEQHMVTAEELEAEIEETEELMSTMGENAQVANIELQHQLQKQQQTVQMLSNVSKILHDTAMAVIRKAG
jgi:hypothetical protein